MRTLLLLAVLHTLLTPGSVDARLFWQTYGATVAADGGCGAGCAWNVNQDYFVPRHCDSGRYGLFSPCKTAHTRSAACKHLHPIYRGYCTPYGSCHYKWRDHVYKTYCGCTPLSHKYGPWHLDRCQKHPLVLRHADPLACAACGLAATHATGEYARSPAEHYGLSLCNVEPFGGETLGTVAAISAGVGGGSTAAATPTTAGPPTPTKINLSPASTGGSGLPAPFNY